MTVSPGSCLALSIGLGVIYSLTPPTPSPSLGGGGGGWPGGQPLGPRLTISLFFFPLCPRVKAKKGVTLLGTKSRSGQWHVTSELLTGAKHSTATVDVAWAQGTPLPPW